MTNHNERQLKTTKDSEIRRNTTKYNSVSKTCVLAEMMFIVEQRFTSTVSSQLVLLQNAPYNTCLDNTYTAVDKYNDAKKLQVTIQDAQLSQRDRAAGCITVFAKSRRLELGYNILRTL